MSLLGRTQLGFTMLGGGIEGAQAVRHEALRRAVPVCGCYPCRDERGRHDDRRGSTRVTCTLYLSTSGMIGTTTSLLDRDREHCNDNLKCHTWCRSLSALKFGNGCAYVDLVWRDEVSTNECA